MHRRRLPPKPVVHPLPSPLGPRRLRSGRTIICRLPAATAHSPKDIAARASDRLPAQDLRPTQFDLPNGPLNHVGSTALPLFATRKGPHGGLAARVRDGNCDDQPTGRRVGGHGDAAVVGVTVF